LLFGKVGFLLGFEEAPILKVLFCHHPLLADSGRSEQQMKRTAQFLGRPLNMGQRSRHPLPEVANVPIVRPRLPYAKRPISRTELPDPLTEP
jgi:hypothetical protein